MLISWDKPFKGTVRPDWICMRVVPLERPGKGHQPLDFLFFNFDLEFLKKPQSSEPLHTKMHLVLQPVGITGCMVTNRNLFHQPGLQKCGKVFGLRLVSKEFQHSAIQTRIAQHFGRFFHQINVLQPIGRKDSIQTVIQTSRRLDWILYEAAQNFEVFSNIQKWNYKIENIKRLMFFQSLSNGTTLMQIQSGRTVPEKALNGGWLF